MTRPKACEKCGLEHPRCKAHNNTGKPCGRIPAKGFEVCKNHGADAPQTRAAVATREAERKAAIALRRRWANGDETPVEDPLTELARIAAEAIAFKDYLRDQVAGLNGVLTYWQEKDYLDTDGAVEWTKAAEDVRAIVAAYERAQDRCAKVLANIVKLDLQAKLLELNRAKAAMIVGAVREGLEQVDMGAELRRAAESAIADQLALLARPIPHDPPKELAG